METPRHLMLLLILVESVNTLNFNIYPNEVVLGSTDTLTMNCSTTEHYTQVYNIKIKRQKSPGSVSDVILASFVSGVAAINDEAINEAINDEAINDETINDESINERNINDESINERNINVTGDLNGNPSFLQLTMKVEKMTLLDARMYKCELNYDDGLNSFVEHNTTISVLGAENLSPRPSSDSSLTTVADSLLTVSLVTVASILVE